jgi:hypothetical protein
MNFQWHKQQHAAINGLRKLPVDQERPKGFFEIMFIENLGIILS